MIRLHSHCPLSVAVVNPSPKRNQFLSPRDEEERRRLLKQLVAPKESKDKSKRRASVFDSMIIKAARSAENLPVTEATAATALSPAEAGGRDNFRKESTASLQVCMHRVLKIPISPGTNISVNFFLIKL